MSDEVGFFDLIFGLKNDWDLLFNWLSELVGINIVDKVNGIVVVFMEVGGTLVDDIYFNNFKLFGGLLVVLDVEIIKKDGLVMKLLMSFGGCLGGIMMVWDMVFKKMLDELD